MAETTDGLPILFEIGLFAFNKQYKNRCSPRMRQAMEDIEFVINQQDKETQLFDNRLADFHNVESTPPSLDSIEPDPLSDSATDIPLPELPTNGETTEQPEQIQAQIDDGQEKTQATDGTLVHDSNTDDDPFGLNEPIVDSKSPTDTHPGSAWNAAALAPTHAAYTSPVWPSPYQSPQLSPSTGTQIHSESSTEDQYHAVKQKTDKINLRYCPFCRNDLKAYIDSVPYKRPRRF